MVSMESLLIPIWASTRYAQIGFRVSAHLSAIYDHTACDHLKEI